MPTTMEDVTAKIDAVEIDPKSGLALKEKAIEGELKTTETTQEKTNEAKSDPEKEPNGATFKEEEVPVEVEPKTGVSFPVKLEDGKQLKAVGLRKKSMLGMGIKIYGFGNTPLNIYLLTYVLIYFYKNWSDYLATGIYADNEKLKDLMQSKIAKAPSKPTKEMYQMVIDSDLGMMMRLVIIFSNLTMNMVRKNFDEGLGAAIKKLTGGKNEELTKKYYN
uniref:Chalcone isomerase n=1 Tax=Solanum tuberosum TaxID=4113 RepID=G3E947_SOLTU|nr:chalcone isomerase [Solanum tuberosum]